MTKMDRTGRFGCFIEDKSGVQSVALGDSVSRLITRTLVDRVLDGRLYDVWVRKSQVDRSGMFITPGEGECFKLVVNISLRNINEAEIGDHVTNSSIDDYLSENVCERTGNRDGDEAVSTHDGKSFVKELAGWKRTA